MAIDYISNIVEDTTMEVLFPIILDQANQVEQYENIKGHTVANMIRAIPPLIAAGAAFTAMSAFRTSE